MTERIQSGKEPALIGQSGHQHQVAQVLDRLACDGRSELANLLASDFDDSVFHWIAGEWQDPASTNALDWLLTHSWQLRQEASMTASESP
jgi:hypothetical protein